MRSHAALSLPVFVALHFVCTIGWFTDADLRYGLVIDLGTGGSRMHIFCWPSDSAIPYADVIYAPPNDQKNPWFLKTTPGVATFADNPSQAGLSLKPLLDFAASKVPVSEQAKSKLFIKGTEGLRATGSAAALILESIYNFAAKNYSFSIDTQHVALISGIQEGVFAWISVNKLSGLLDESDVLKSTGVLDMGQGSTQITFLPTTNTHIPLTYNYTFVYKSNVYKLYSHSFSGYGYYASLYSVNASVVTSHAHSAQVENPCFLTGFSQSVVGNPPKVVRGTGDWRLCSNYTEMFLNKSVPCSFQTCSFNGAYQPNLRGSFFAISNFRDTTKFLGLKTKSIVKEIIDQGESYCSISWADAKKDNPTVLESDLASYCFGANYITKLLTYGYGMDLDFSLTIDKNVGSFPASWAYGLMINELQLGHA